MKEAIISCACIRARAQRIRARMQRIRARTNGILMANAPGHVCISMYEGKSTCHQQGAVVSTCMQGEIASRFTRGSRPAIRGHQWSSVVISGHPRSSVVIRGHQWESRPAWRATRSVRCTRHSRVWQSAVACAAACRRRDPPSACRKSRVRRPRRDGSKSSGPDEGRNHRSSEVIRGHQRSSEVIRGQSRSSEVISGHQRSSAVIRGHPRSSEVIRGNQCTRMEIRHGIGRKLT